MLNEAMIAGAIKSFFTSRIPNIARYFGRSEEDINNFINNMPGMYEDAKRSGYGLLNKFGITKEELLNVQTKLGHRASEIPIVGDVIEGTFNRAMKHVSDPNYGKNREQRRAEKKSGEVDRKMFPRV